MQEPIYPFTAQMRPTELVVHAPLEDFLHQRTRSIVRHGKIALGATVFHKREPTHPIKRVRYALLVGIQNLTFVPTAQTASTAKKAGKIYAHQENMVSPTLTLVTAFRPTVLVNHARLGNIVPLKTRPW